MHLQVQRRIPSVVLSLMLIGTLSGCVKKIGDDTVKDSTSHKMTTIATPTQAETQANNFPVTLPVIDAFLSDSSFAQQAKSKVGLSDSEFVKVRMLAHEEAVKDEQAQTANTGEYSGSTAAARAHAIDVLRGAIGEDKATKLITLVRDEWSGREQNSTTASNDSVVRKNVIPTDSRVVVNIPAFRMDVFENGKLAKSYKIAIGYPEFPLPTGIRRGQRILFNPTWTPPNESWVESPKGKVKIGQKIGAGDKLNPLGVVKIPIGEPSLIHGGKTAVKLGTFGSHGCVGLIDADAKDFAKRFAHIGGKEISDSDITSYVKDKKTTHEVKLPQVVQVDLRYETIMVDSGKLHIYRDVYDHNTNTEGELAATLKSYGLTTNDLTADEKSQIVLALRDMSRDITTNTDTTIHREIATKDSLNSEAGVTAPAPAKKDSKSSTPKDTRPKMTQTIKGQKETVIPIAALKGKGYPQPVDMSVIAVSAPKKPAKKK